MKLGGCCSSSEEPWTHPSTWQVRQKGGGDSSGPKPHSRESPKEAQSPHHLRLRSREKSPEQAAVASSLEMRAQQDSMWSGQLAGALTGQEGLNPSCKAGRCTGFCQALMLPPVGPSAASLLTGTTVLPQQELAHFLPECLTA